MHQEGGKDNARVLSHQEGGKGNARVPIDPNFLGLVVYHCLGSDGLVNILLVCQVGFTSFLHTFWRFKVRCFFLIAVSFPNLPPKTHNAKYVSLEFNLKIDGLPAMKLGPFIVDPPFVIVPTSK